AGATSLAMLWLNALGLTLDRQLAVVAALAAALSLGVWLNTLWPRVLRRRIAESVPGAVADRPMEQPTRRSHPGEPASAPGQPAAGERWSRAATALLSALIALQIAWVALLAVGRPLTYWDSWGTWGMKARIIVLDGQISAGVFADPSRTATLLDYPLL